MLLIYIGLAGVLINILVACYKAVIVNDPNEAEESVPFIVIFLVVFLIGLFIK